MLTNRLRVAILVRQCPVRIKSWYSWLKTYRTRGGTEAGHAMLGWEFVLIMLGSLYAVWLAFYCFMRWDAKKRGELEYFLGKEEDEKKKHEM